MVEALATLDTIAGHFLDSIGEVGREASKGKSGPDLQRIADVTGAATIRLRDNIAIERATLKTGRAPE